MIVNLKRCLSILLAVMLLIGIIPAAYAVESGADSTQPEKTVSEGTDSIDPTEPTEPTEPPDIPDTQDDYAVMSVGSTQKSILLFILRRTHCRVGCFWLIISSVTVVAVTLRDFSSQYTVEGIIMFSLFLL